MGDLLMSFFQNFSAFSFHLSHKEINFKSNLLEKNKFLIQSRGDPLGGE